MKADKDASMNGLSFLFLINDDNENFTKVTFSEKENEQLNFSSDQCWLQSDTRNRCVLERYNVKGITKEQRNEIQIDDIPDQSKGEKNWITKIDNKTKSFVMNDINQLIGLYFEKKYSSIKPVIHFAVLKNVNECLRLNENTLLIFFRETSIMST